MPVMYGNSIALILHEIRRWRAGGRHARSWRRSTRAVVVGGRDEHCVTQDVERSGGGHHGDRRRRGLRHGQRHRPERAVCPWVALGSAFPGAAPCRRRWPGGRAQDCGRARRGGTGALPLRLPHFCAIPAAVGRTSPSSQRVPRRAREAQGPRRPDREPCRVPDAARPRFSGCSCVGLREPIAARVHGAVSRQRLTRHVLGAC